MFHGRLPDNADRNLSLRKDTLYQLSRKPPPLPATQNSSPTLRMPQSSNQIHWRLRHDIFRYPNLQSKEFNRKKFLGSTFPEALSIKFAWFPK